MNPTLDLMTPEARANPYPLYAQLRRSGIRQVEPGGMWAVSRYDDVVAVMKDPRRFSSAGLAQGFLPSWLSRNPITESLVMQNPEFAAQLLTRIRELGAGLALDDFGTGYSSLIYLRRFAFDKIKIDRSFLESMEATGESAILVHSIVHLGRALGLTVTAEGVETKEQHRFLQALGCHQLQGFLFSRPIPAADVDVLLGIAPPAENASAA